MAVDVIIGLQRGDEGKGRFVDMFAKDYDIVARFNGGNNAGHTVVLNGGEVLKLHLVPSGIAHPGKINIIGNGTLVNPIKLIEEIATIESKGIKVTPDNLKISSGAHLILPHHIFDDQIREAGLGRQGSTKSGIAQVASSKAMRTGIRMEAIVGDTKELRRSVYEALVAQRAERKDVKIDDIDEKAVADDYVESTKQLKPFVIDTVFYLNQELRKAKPARVLAEGAQAFLLDVDHGMYPFTTSTSTTSGGVATGLGIPPMFVEKVFGVAKAVQSHVGGGPFVTEVTDEDELAMLHGDMHTVDAEYGTTTGRKRRLGHFDIPQIRRAQMINGVSGLLLSKVDWVPRYGDFASVCIAYRYNGKTIDIAPDSAQEFEKCEPVYKELPTWKENIQGVREFSKLPKNAQNYVKFIEDQTGVPVVIIGVGPRPEQMIIRSADKL
jgi:adenylosuccinate synthase